MTINDSVNQKQITSRCEPKGVQRVLFLDAVESVLRVRINESGDEQTKNRVYFS